MLHIEQLTLSERQLTSDITRTVTAPGLAIISHFVVYFAGEIHTGRGVLHESDV